MVQIHTVDGILVRIGGFLISLRYVFAFLTPIFALNFLYHLATILKDDYNDAKEEQGTLFIQTTSATLVNFLENNERRRKANETMLESLN